MRYSIYSGDPDGYFSIDPVSGNIRVSNMLDHEAKAQVLLNIQATSGDPPSYGHTQVITFFFILLIFQLYTFNRFLHTSKEIFQTDFEYTFFGIIFHLFCKKCI